MHSLEERFADYEAHHRTAGNKLTHAVGIPLIATALLGLASGVPVYALPAGPTVDLGVGVAALLVALFLRWHVGLALGCAALLVPLYLVGRSIPAPWLAVLLAVGVGLQYLGHVAFEHNRPAFHRNAVHTIIGPLWIASRLFRALGLFRA